MSCSTGKVSHATREAALEHQKALVYSNHITGQSERSKGLNVYPCQECAAWHVGHTAETMPLVYHYTIARFLDAILTTDALKPRAVRKDSLAIFETTPMLWFSWNPEWDHSVVKDPLLLQNKRTPEDPPTGRAMTEIAGQGLVRFGAPASVAKLRWNDYLARNRTPPLARDAMSLRGNPAEWLATDQRVALAQCVSFDVWYRGEWIPAESVSDEDFDIYTDERARAYDLAWFTLREKLHQAKQSGLDEVKLQLTTDEAVLFQDYWIETQEEKWRVDHLPQIHAFNVRLQAQQRGRRKYKGMR